MRWFLLAALLVWPSSAVAQDEGPYRARIQEAVAEFDAHRFPEARALFYQAHAIQPNARTLRGIGLASFEMGDYVEAYRALGAALEDERRPLTEPQRASAAEVRERARRFLGVYALDVSPPDAVVTVDGAPAARDGDGRVVLALGGHAVRAEAPDHGPANVRVVVRGGEEDTLRLAATPPRRAPSPPPSAPLADPRPPLEPAPSLVAPDPTPAIALLVTGGALAAGAVVAGLAWWLGRADGVQRCVEAGASCFNLADLELARDAAAGTTIGLAVLGVAGLVSGGVWLGALGGDGDAVACGVRGVGVGCSGRF